MANPGFQRGGGGGGGGGLRSGPIRDGGVGVLLVFSPIRKAGGGVLPASGLIREVGGMIAYQEARDIVEFMRTGINRQRKRTAIIIKRGPKRYEFINGRTYGRGGCSSTRSTPPPWIRH